MSNNTNYAGEIPAPQVPPFTASPGMRVPLAATATPLQYLELFFTVHLWQYLVDRTNAYATVRLGRMPPRRRSLFRNWKAVTMAEMKAFVGVILNMGLVQLPRMKDYWATHETLNLQFFQRVFSRDRFLQIFWMLHVGDIDGSTRRSKIQPLLDMVIPTICQYFVPGKAVAVDEAMITYRGRVSFRQYVKGKPHPWGIKAYVLADSASGYLHSLAIYYGRETQLIARPDLNHTTRAVLTVTQPLFHQGYNLYTDRFYTSPLLAAELERVGTTLTGRVMCNRKDMPNAVRQKRRRIRGETHTYHKGNMLCIEWTDKRTLLTLTTKHSNQMVDVPSR